MRNKISPDNTYSCQCHYVTHTYLKHNFARAHSEYIYQPQRSCGQGNIFTPVCHSVHRGGFCLNACWDTNLPPTRHPPGADTPPPDQPPQEQTPPRADTPQQTPPPDQADTPPQTRQTPTRTRESPAYGLRAAGTHPTGMHSCFFIICTKFPGPHEEIVRLLFISRVLYNNYTQRQKIFAPFTLTPRSIIRHEIRLIAVLDILIFLSSFEPEEVRNFIEDNISADSWICERIISIGIQILLWYLGHCFCLFVYIRRVR